MQNTLSLKGIPQIRVWLNRKLKARVKAAAKKTGQTQGDFAISAVNEWLARRPTPEAIIAALVAMPRKG